MITPIRLPASQMPVPREGPASLTAAGAAPAHQGEAARRKEKRFGSCMHEPTTHGCMEPAPATATHRGLFEIYLLQKEDSKETPTLQTDRSHRHQSRVRVCSSSCAQGRAALASPPTPPAKSTVGRAPPVGSAPGRQQRSSWCHGPCQVPESRQTKSSRGHLHFGFTATTEDPFFFS